MCPYCVGYECTECLFCTKFYHNGQRIIKKTEVSDIHGIKI